MATAPSIFQPAQVSTVSPSEEYEEQREAKARAKAAEAQKDADAERPVPEYQRTTDRVGRRQEVNRCAHPPARNRGERSQWQ